MLFTVKKYWKDSRDTSQSGSLLGNGAAGAGYMATGWE